MHYVFRAVTILSANKIRTLVVFAFSFSNSFFCQCFSCKPLIIKAWITCYAFTNCWTNNILMFFLVSYLPDLVENFDEASKNEANWRTLFFLRQPFYVLPRSDSQRAFPLVLETVVKSAMHLRRREALRFSLPQQQHADTVGFHFSRLLRCGHGEKRGSARLSAPKGLQLL